MKIKRFLNVLLVLLLLSPSLYSSEKIKIGDQGTFELEAVSKVGYDIGNNSAGIESYISKIQIWFELFPYADERGVPLWDEQSDVPYASIRILGSKFALKWFGNHYKPTDGALNYTENAVQPIMFDDFYADVNWRSFWFGVAGTWSLMSVDRASLKNIIESSLVTPARDMLLMGSGDYPVSGILYFGNRSDIFELTLKIGSEKVFTENADNAFSFGMDMSAKPVEGLELNASAVGGLNYSYYGNEQNPVGFGTDISYEIPLSDSFTLKPYAGFDGKYYQGEFSYEIGGGLFLYWPSVSAKAYNMLNEFYGYDSDPYSADTNTGASLSANHNDEGVTNLVFAVFEDSSNGSLIPSLGFTLLAELKDITGVSERKIGLGGEVEYVIEKFWKPYVYSHYTVTENFGSEPFEWNLKTGLKYTGIRNLSVTLQYEKLLKDTSEDNYDYITLEFVISN